ncbi:MAG: lipocalin family protein [Bacteroidota bacterium]
MKLIKDILLFSLLLLMSFTSFAQKQTYDVVTYTMPKGWDKIVSENGVQLSTKDDGKGNYAAAVIVKSIASNASAKDNFTDSWEKLVKGTVKVNEAPTMSDMGIEKGWNCITGQTNYTDGATKGLVTLITATGNGKMANVVIMTNTSKYKEEVLAFVNSLGLNETAIAQNKTTTVAVQNNSSVNASVVGLWTNYILETTGNSINGSPQYTAGYLRKEYAFYPDGTYLFRNKQWLTKTKDILFIYEFGTYAVNENQLTITPRNGKSGFWQKTTSTKEWGKQLKTSDYKLEKTTYSFTLNNDPDYGNKIILKSTKPTQRDGGQFNTPNDPYEFRYSFRDLASNIDNPPGFKMDLENKPLIAETPPTKSIGNTINSALIGKIWEGSSSEKFTGAGAMTGHYTGGFSSSQYKFNADGTYRFVDVVASFYTETKTLKYETGTWSVNGDQLTINPANGQNEEWSKVGKTFNGNSDVSNRTINETWGKKLKTNIRKLENYTYTFSIGKNGDKNALILQRNGRTEREGEGKISYFNETLPDRSIKLPNLLK